MRDRFNRKWVLNPDNGCWDWQGKLNKDGYGSFWINAKGRSVVASRVAYELFKGPFEDRLVVRHTCDRPRCVNPEHLRLGTTEDNVKDRDRRGRTARGQGHGSHTKPESVAQGERNGRALLSEADVIEMRHLRGKGAIYSQLATRFKVSKSQVFNICTGKQWATL